MSNRNYIFNRKKLSKKFPFGFEVEMPLNTSVDYRGYYAECQKHVKDAAPATYLQRFGLPFEFLAGYGVGYDPERELIIVPHSQAFT